MDLIERFLLNPQFHVKYNYKANIHFLGDYFLEIEEGFSDSNAAIKKRIHTFFGNGITLHIICPQIINYLF